MHEIATILEEVSQALRTVSERQLEAMAREIAAAHHIFVAGAGRSGLMVRACANRLMHLGLSTSAAGDIDSPRSQARDALLIGSGSGETTSLVRLGERAQTLSMRVLLVTADPKSTLADLADRTLIIPAPSKISATPSRQPMASAFEQSSLMVYDALVLRLMDMTAQTPRDLAARHADLE